jgi:hypothetical protein
MTPPPMAAPGRFAASRPSSPSPRFGGGVRDRSAPFPIRAGQIADGTLRLSQRNG